MIQISTKNAARHFVRSVHTALRIYGPVRRSCIWNYESIIEDAFHPRVASKIVGLAFLSMMVAWEEYLEDTFLRYMAGATSESGYSPMLRIGRCMNTRHSIQVLTGATNIDEGLRFVRWNDYDWALTKAEIFFRKGEPYSRIPADFQKRLKDAQIVRNRIAHSSLKARNQFKKMVNRNIGAAPGSALDYGFSPGRYLIYNKPEIVFQKSWVDSKDCEWPDLFECYVHMFLEMVNIISP